jgi:hypothetical protein
VSRRHGASRRYVTVYHAVTVCHAASRTRPPRAHHRTDAVINRIARLRYDAKKPARGQPQRGFFAVCNCRKRPLASMHPLWSVWAANYLFLRVLVSSLGSVNDFNGLAGILRPCPANVQHLDRQSAGSILAENIQAELQSWAELKDVVSELWLSGSRAKGRLISGQRRRYRASVDACRAGTRLGSRRLTSPSPQTGSASFMAAALRTQGRGASRGRIERLMRR